MTSKSEKSPKKSESDPDTPFSPNRCFYIAKHTGFGSTVKIYDISSDVDLSDCLTGASLDKWGAVAMDVGIAKAKEAAKPFLEIQPHTWYGFKYSACKPSSEGKDQEVASWQSGVFSSSTNHITFPADSTHCSHPIAMTVDSYVKMRDNFVIESVPFTWAVMNAWSMRQFRLSQTVGDTTTPLARFWQSKMQFVQGGILVLDDRSLDAIVAIMTCIVMLRKQRQKMWEYS